MLQVTEKLKRQRVRINGWEILVESKLWNSLSARGDLQDEEERCSPAPPSRVRGNCFSESKHKGREKQLALNDVNEQKAAHNLLFQRL